MLILQINFFNCTATQKKCQELFRRPSYSYVLWGAEPEFEVKIAPYPIIFGYNLKKRYFRVDDGKIWYHRGFQAAEFNNEARLWSYITKKFVT